MRRLTEIEAAYWAALFDGEGTIHHAKNGQYFVGITMTERDLMFEFLSLFFGQAKMYLRPPDSNYGSPLRMNKAAWTVQLTKNADKEAFLAQVTEFLRVSHKRNAARHFLLERQDRRLTPKEFGEGS